MLSGLDGVRGVSVLKHVGMVHVYVVECVSLRIQLRCLLLYHVLGKLNKTKLVPNGTVQVDIALIKTVVLFDVIIVIVIVIVIGIGTALPLPISKPSF